MSLPQGFHVTTAHAWMPLSPCGAGCIPPDRPGAGRWIAATRLFRTAGVLAAAPALFTVQPLLPGAQRVRLQCAFSRLLLASLGLRIVVVDKTGGVHPQQRGVLIVANHVSWLDPVVISAIAPSSFVARADMLTWPVIGQLARWARTIPIARENLRALPGTLHEVTRRLRAGHRVAVFPEGTTWCGRSWGTFRPAFFQAAFDSAASVAPVHIRYTDAAGKLRTEPCFVGDDGFAQAFLRVLRLRDTTVEITLLQHEPPIGDRKTLAARCQAHLRESSFAQVTFDGSFSPDPIVA